MSQSVLENIEKSIYLVKNNFIHYFKIIAIPYILLILSIIGCIGFLFGAIYTSKNMIIASILFGIMSIICCVLTIKFLWDVIRMIIPVCYLTKDLIYNNEIQPRKHYLSYTHNRNLKLFLLILTIIAIPIVSSLVFASIIYAIAFFTKIQMLNILSTYVNMLLLYICAFCFCLALPIFVFNKDLSILSCFKQSFMIVKNNFIKILLLFGLIVSISIVLNIVLSCTFVVINLVTFPIIFFSKLASVIIFLTSGAIILFLMQILSTIFGYTIPAIWYIELTKSENTNTTEEEQN